MPDVGSLYIVATPIGNLGDMTTRAIQILAEVDLILAEDTRHANKLLSHFSINTPMRAWHEHNEKQKLTEVMEQLTSGKNIALISDAGTPLINDPGYILVRAAVQEGIHVVPIPGCCAVITALSAAGLESDKFQFIGFLPHKSTARRDVLNHHKQFTGTLIYYESCHRIIDSLGDLSTVIEPERQVVVARELTKTYEQFYRGNVESVIATLTRAPNHTKGEFVVLVEKSKQASLLTADIEGLLRTLLEEVPIKQAAKLAAKITGKHKQELYQAALRLQGK